MNQTFTHTYLISFGRSLVCRMAGVVLVLLLFAVSGCRHTPDEVTGRMEVADSIMEERPDSALTILESVDTAQLHGRADRARYALLKSMAIDKNLIDTATFSILQPAIDYYLKHGTPDQRLKTRYYEGRIHMNRGDDAAALTSFLQAAEDSAACTDPRALALLNIARGLIYVKQYNYDLFKENNRNAAEIYRACGDTLNETVCMARVLLGECFDDDRRMIDSIMKSYSSYFEKYLIKDKHIQDILTTVYIYYTTPSELQKFISRLDSIPSHSIDTQLGIALGLSRLGQHDTALRRMPDERSLRNMEDTLRYLAIKSEILEESSRFEEALTVYKMYLSDFENDMNRIFNDDVLFTQEKYRLEMSAQAALQHQKNRKNLFIILTLVTLLILVVVAYLLYIKSSRLSLSDEQQKRLMEQLENERMRLESITNRNEHIDSLINKRLSMLNGIIASEVSGDTRYRKDFDKICKQISEEKVKFLSNLTKEIGELCPALIEAAEDAGLSETQLQCLCLLALGVKVKDMSGYLGIGGIYNFTNEIRRKIGLGSDTNLGLYVRGMMRGGA